MQKKILIVCGVTIGVIALLLIGAMLFVSPEWEVVRSRTIEAPVVRIHAAVADLHGWPEWTAWNREADPDATWSFEGAPAGQGAVMRWNGPRFGQGRLTLLEADQTGVSYELVVESNDDMTATGRIAYQPSAEGVVVTWTDRGSLGWNPFLRLLKPVFENSMGQSFEQGLAGLAERVEGS